MAGAIDGDNDYVDRTATATRDKKQYRGPALDNQQYPISLKLWKEYNFDLAGNKTLLNKDDSGKITAVQLNSIENYFKYVLTTLVDNSQKKYPNRKIEAILLGCTHYPFFMQTMYKHLIYLKHSNKKYDKIIPKNILLIDPAQSLAIDVYKYMTEEQLFGDNKDEISGFYISIPNKSLKQNQIDSSGNFPYHYKYGRNINQNLEYVKRVSVFS